MFDEPLPEAGQDPDAIVDEWAAKVRPHATHLGSPRYFGFGAVLFRDPDRQRRAFSMQAAYKSIGIGIYCKYAELLTVRTNFARSDGRSAGSGSRRVAQARGPSR